MRDVQPQAWAAGSMPCMLAAGLGLVPDGLRRTLRIRRPLLPRRVNRLALQGLRVAGARVHLLFERVAQCSWSVALTDVQVDGHLEVVLETLHAGVEAGRWHSRGRPVRNGQRPLLNGP